MPDFGFVGASYEAPSIYQDAQECINFYPEQDPTKSPGERGIVALYPTPGLVTEITLPAASEVRGMRALSGSQYLVVVSGNRVYSVTTSFVATQIGTLTTSTGPVQITDTVTTNNGLTAYIVDGANRYTWVASTNTFATLPVTDGLWTGATACDTVDNYVAYNEPNTQNWAVTDLGLVVSTTGNYGTTSTATLGLTVDPSGASVTDAAGNALTSAAVSGTNQSYNLDTTAPTAAVTYSPNRTVKSGETLTITATNGDVNCVPAGPSYAAGTVVRLIPEPNVGYSFSSWSGAVTSKLLVVYVTMDADKNITATFAIDTYTLAVTPTGTKCQPTAGVAVSCTTVPWS